MADGIVSTTGAAFLGLLLIVIGLLYSYFKTLYSCFEESGLKYVKPVPFLGSYSELKRSGTPAFCGKYISKFKSNFGFFVFNKKFIVLYDTRVLKDVLIKKFSNFQSRFAKTINVAVDYTGLFQMNGETWRRNRTALSPSFSTGKMKQMLALIKESTQTLLDVINKTQNEESVNANRIFESYTMEVIGTTAFGIQLDSQRDPEEKFLKWCRKVFVYLQTNKPALDFKIVDFEKKSIQNFWHSTLDTLFKMRLQDNSRKDLLQSMMERLPEHVGENDKGHMSKEDVMGNMMTFLLAGYETTSNALSYTAYLLAKNQYAQEKLHREITDLVGNKEVSYDTLMALPYLEQVVKEALRLFPPVHTVTRVCVSTCEVEGLGRVEAGTRILLPVYYIHRDPNLWPDPNAFNPERFSKENESTIEPYSYLPFGEGQRQCIGMRFALVEAKVALIGILRQYRIVPTAKTEDTLELVHGITMTAKNGVHVKFVRR